VNRIPKATYSDKKPSDTATRAVIYPYVFTDKYERQNFQRILDKLPKRATITDLENSGEFGSKENILTDISRGIGPNFTCDRAEAAYYASQLFKSCNDKINFTHDPEGDLENIG
jgi:hypothetical protein